VQLNAKNSTLRSLSTITHLHSAFSIIDFTLRFMHYAILHFTNRQDARCWYVHVAISWWSIMGKMWGLQGGGMQVWQRVNCGLNVRRLTQVIVTVANTNANTSPTNSNHTNCTYPPPYTFSPAFNPLSTHTRIPAPLHAHILPNALGVGLVGLW